MAESIRQPGPQLADRGVSPREADVLSLVVARFDNADIAAALCISKRTVESHIAALLRKLAVPDRHALVRVGGELVDAAQPVLRDVSEPAGQRNRRRSQLVAEARSARVRAARLRSHSARRQQVAFGHIERSLRRLERSRSLINKSVEGRPPPARAGDG